MTSMSMFNLLSSISIPLEPKPELQNIVVELTPEPVLPGTFPFSVHNLKCYILHGDKLNVITRQ